MNHELSHEIKVERARCMRAVQELRTRLAIRKTQAQRERFEAQERNKAVDIHTGRISELESIETDLSLLITEIEEPEITKQDGSQDKGKEEADQATGGDPR